MMIQISHDHKFQWVESRIKFALCVCHLHLLLDDCVTPPFRHLSSENLSQALIKLVKSADYVGKGLYSPNSHHHHCIIIISSSHHHDIIISSWHRNDIIISYHIISSSHHHHIMISGQALVPYYRQLLPVFNLFKQKNCKAIITIIIIIIITITIIVVIIVVFNKQNNRKSICSLSTIWSFCWSKRNAWKLFILGRTSDPDLFKARIPRVHTPQKTNFLPKFRLRMQKPSKQHYTSGYTILSLYLSMFWAQKQKSSLRHFLLQIIGWVNLTLSGAGGGWKTPPPLILLRFPEKNWWEKLPIFFDFS